MKLLRRILLAPNEAPIPVSTQTGELPESIAAASSTLAAKKTAVSASEAIAAAALQQISPLTLLVTSPTAQASIGFPFVAYGTATRGATVRVYNTVSGALLGTAVADAVTGNWSIPISSL